MDIACPTPQKRTKSISSEKALDEPTGVELVSEDSTKASSHSPCLKGKVEQLKRFFLDICRDDCIDLEVYRGLDDAQVRVVAAILGKRYKDSLLRELATAGSEIKTIESFAHMKPKRMDHTEKSILSVQLTVLRDKFKAEHYGTSRPKDLHDEINKRLFRRYFAEWQDPDQLISIASADSPRAKTVVPPEELPRHSAIFCMKKGLTRFWFKAVSTKFLDAVVNINVEEIKRFCNSRFEAKLEEIFGECSADSNTYFDALADKVQNSKFKLPLTLREIEFSYQKTNKKMTKLRRVTEDSELQEFQTRFGAESYYDQWARWRQEASQRPDSPL